MKYTMLLLLGFLCMTDLEARGQEAKRFQLTTERVVCPEYGTISFQHVLLMETRKVVFRLPDSWEMSAEASQQRIAVAAPDHQSSITLYFKFPDTNTLANAESETPKAGDAATVTAAKFLEGRFPGATVKSDNPCFAAAMQGRVVDFQFVDALRRTASGRMAVLKSGEGQIEIVAVSCGDWPHMHVEYTKLLNSLAVQRLAPPKKENS